MRSRTTPALPVRFVYGVSQPSGEQSLQRPVISAVPPSNGKSAPLLLERQVDAAVEQDVAAGEQGPGGRRVEGVGRGRGGEAGGQRPRAEVLDPVDAEQRRVAPGERPDLRPDRVGAQEGESLAVLGEVLGQGRGVGGEDQALGVGRALDVERGQDGVGLALDQLQRRVAGAGAGQDGLELLRAGRGRDGAEVRDRDDRDVGDLGGRRRAWAGPRSASRMGLAPTIGGWRLTGLGRVAGARSTSARRSRRSIHPPGPSWPTASTATSDDEDEAERDRDRVPFHRPECDRGCRGRAVRRPPGQRNAPSGRADGA